MKRLYLYIILLLLLIPAAFLFRGCRVSYFNFDTRNMAFLYNPGITMLHPECFIYHPNDTVSLMFFKINTNELYFNTQSKEFFNKARIQIHFRLLDAAGKNEIIDSATVSYFIQRSLKQTKFITYIPFRTNKPQKYTMEVLYLDYFRHRGSQTILTFDKSSESASQNFFLSSSQAREPWFQNTFNEYNEIKIKYERRIISKLFVKYFNKEFPMPLPPFSSKKISPELLQPDSVWSIDYNDSTVFKLPKKGMYFIQIDSGKTEGMALYNFGNYYPEIKEAEDLIKPIRFLTTKKKYEQYNAYENIKVALDDFWLDATGNVTRSKELIRIYYNRVQQANKYFVSYTEGWKTDRGMIYTIFGSPGIIYKSENMEKWIYGDKSNIQSLNFTFEKVDNPYSENDYILNRHDIYKTSWFQAVDVWRKGRAYAVEN